MEMRESESSKVFKEIKGQSGCGSDWICVMPRRVYERERERGLLREKHNHKLKRKKTRRR